MRSRTSVIFFAGTTLIRTRIGAPVATRIDVYGHGRTVNVYMAFIEGVIISAPVMVPVTVMGIVMVMPVIMVTIVIVPVVGPPGAPVPGVVSPVPG